MDKQTVRQIVKYADGQIDRQTNGQMDKWTVDRYTDRQIDKQTNEHMDRQIDNSQTQFFKLIKSKRIVISFIVLYTAFRGYRM